MGTAWDATAQGQHVRHGNVGLGDVGTWDTGWWGRGDRTFPNSKKFWTFLFSDRFFLSEINRSAMVHPPCLDGDKQSIKS